MKTEELGTDERESGSEAVMEQRCQNGDEAKELGTSLEIES